MSAALEAEGASAVCLIVGGDERLRTLRHPLAVGDVVSDALMAVVVAKRAGLHVAATRLCTRSADDEIVTLMKTLGSINDQILEASLPGGTWGDTMIALALAYDDAGYHDAWREHFQGGPIGFEQREFELAPTQMTHRSGRWRVAPGRRWRGIPACAVAPRLKRRTSSEKVLNSSPRRRRGPSWRSSRILPQRRQGFVARMKGST
jgi:hypothetical protein